MKTAAALAAACIAALGTAAASAAAETAGDAAFATTEAPAVELRSDVEAAPLDGNAEAAAPAGTPPPARGREAADAPPPAAGAPDQARDAPASPDADRPPGTPEDIEAAEDDYFDRHVEEFARDPTSPEAAGAAAAPRGGEPGGPAIGYLRIMGVLALLSGAIVICGYLARRYGRNTPLLAGQDLGEVAGRLYLSPRASLHFVKTGGRMLVVGVTPAGMHPIADLPADAFDIAAPGEPAAAPGSAPPPGAFLAQLRAAAARRSPAATTAAAGGDEMASLRSEIQQLQEYLRSRPDAADD